MFGGTRRYHRDYGTYTGIKELILIRKYPKVSQRLRNVYGYYRTYPYTKVPVGITEFNQVQRYP